MWENILWRELCPQGCFLPDSGVPGVRSMGPGLSERPLVDLTDVTLADEDNNSIRVDDVNRAIWSFCCHLDGGGARRSTRGSARWWYMSCMSCVGNNTVVGPLGR